MAGAAIMFLLGTVPLMKILTGSPNLAGILFSQMALAIVAGFYFGPSPALMVETYPTRIRYSAIAITTKISGPLFGGATPVLITYIMKLTGSTMIPTYYLVLAAGVSLLALKCLNKGP
jgi:MHS family proline/betaine transporter-like MFS transporter